MPLTVAHPAAVLPLRRSGLPFSALVIGSLAPDLEYLFHLAPRGEIGHTFAGLFIFCLPIGLVSLWLVHRIWWRPIGELFGENEPYARFEFLPIGRFVLLCTALVLGALTHVVWDSFTHSYGWSVRHFPVLAMSIFRTPIGDVRLFKLLQHASTFLGCGIFGLMMFRRKEWLKSVPPAAWRACLVVGCSSAVMGAWSSASCELAGVVIVCSFAGAVGEVTAFAVLSRW